jgi:subtilisin family serine protease
MIKQLFKGATFVALYVAFTACETDLNQSKDVSPTQTNGELAAEMAKDGVPNELLIKFKEGTSDDQKTEILSRISGKLKEKILTKMMARLGNSEGIFLIELPITTADALSRIKGFSEIEYAEPNYICTYNAVSNDPYFTDNSLWGMSSTNPYGCQAATAWANNHTGSNSVYIGVIDEGFLPTHEDLADNVGVNTGEIPNNDIDEDGNGYVDDINGWDFYGNDNTIFDGLNDLHGTHVAGTIGGIGGNNKGVAGVCWSVKLMSGKFIGKKGGTVANAIKAIDYFTNLKTRSINSINIVATNNSWIIGSSFSQSLYDAIARANDANILFIAGAGNDTKNNDIAPTYPSSFDLPNIISVAAIASDGSIANFSSFGASTVDIGAPGVDIVSTISTKLRGNFVSAYTSYSGTSMATPHVTGAVALYASTHPKVPISNIKNAILNSAIPTPSLNGKCVTGARLNVSSF